MYTAVGYQGNTYEIKVQLLTSHSALRVAHNESHLETNKFNYICVGEQII